MTFYTADLHFGHKNIIGFDSRPFDSVEQMDRLLIEWWNQKVTDADTVYIIGDLCYRSVHDPSWYLTRLRGKKYLIIGNHDGPLLEDEKALSLLSGLDKMMTVTDGGREICLCHFPLAEWDGFFGGAWHVYGHIHNKKEETYQIMKTRDRALNAGCMLNGFVPVTFDELIRNNAAFKSL